MKELQPGEWRVALTTRSEDLNNEREWEERYCSTLDRFYALVSEEELEREAAAKARAARARHLTHRPIRYTPGSSRPCSRKHSMSCVTLPSMLVHHPKLCMLHVWSHAWNTAVL